MVPPQPQDKPTTRREATEPTVAQTRIGDGGAPRVEPEDPLATQGTPFGRYRLLSELGRGGMGVVWKAWDTRLRRIVALKQILALREADRSQVERFLREARLAAKLAHPGIVKVHDVDAHEGQRYLTCDYVEGRPLSEVMRATLAPAKAAAWAQEIASALAYAHEQGVIHRDIKPQNVLIDGAGRPHVMDFGLAKEVNASSTGALTMSGDILGTPAYMSPEQASGRVDSTGPATDQFSLGVVLYQLLTEKLPFEAEDLRGTLNAIAEREPVPPSRLRPTLHGDIEAICLKALEKDPSRRYASMRDLAADLQRYLDGEAVFARRVGALSRLARRAARHRRVLVPAAALGLVGAAALAWTVSGWISSRGEAASAQAEAKEQARLAAAERERAEAARDAMQLLEAGRPALDDAQRYLHDAEATYEELVGRVERGKPLIEAAVAKAPGLALGHHLLGRAWELLGWDERAEACWREAIRLDARFAPARFRLGLLLLERGIATIEFYSESDDYAALKRRGDDLLAAAEKELGLASSLPVAAGEDVSEEVLEAALAYAAEDLPRVRFLCEEAVSRLGTRPGSERFHLLHALVSAGEDRLRRLAQALTASPKDAFVLSVRGRLRMSTGAFQEALADYDQAIAIRPRFAPALLNRGLIRYELGDLDGAVQDYDRVLGIDPDNVDALNNRGNVRCDTGQIEAAMADFDRALGRAPLYANAILGRGNVLQARGRLDEALSEFDRALSVRPRLLGARVGRGLVLQARGDLDAALAELNAAVDMAPTSAKALDNRAGVRMRMGDAEGALADLERAIAANPRCAGAYYNRGKLRLDRGDPDGAIADMDEALSIDPRFALAYNRRGRAREAKGDPEGARADYDRALEIDTRLVDALLNRGIARQAQGDLDGAIEDFDAAVEVAPSNEAARLDRAGARLLRGDLDGAMDDFERSLAIKPGSPQVLAGRAATRGVLGDFEGALRDCEAALASAPSEWPHRKHVEDLRDDARGAAPHPRWRRCLRGGRQAIALWGSYAAAERAYEQGFAAGAPERTDDAGERRDLADAHYNRACIRALRSEGKAPPDATTRAVPPAEAARLRDGAIDDLTRAVGFGYADEDHMAADSDLAALHDDPRWSQVLARIRR